VDYEGDIEYNDVYTHCLSRELYLKIFSGLSISLYS
jgi:hypothetical protein